MKLISRDLPFRRVLVVALLGAFAASAPANPTGGSVVGGNVNATIAGEGTSLTTINQTSASAFINWTGFNIAAGETTIFNQPSVNSVVVNRINDQNPSQIWGSLQANGMVVLLNSSGFSFGPDSFVKTGGSLIVSTANCIPPQNSGGVWQFNGPPPYKSIINFGQIQVGNGRSAYLIADQIENHGSIEAPGGSVGLAAGQTVLLSDRPDGRGMSMQVTLPGGSVDNKGKLIADGGIIAMQARVVNQNGLVQANSVQNQNGIIELVASDSIALGANSQITANGDTASSGSAGGQIMVQTAHTFSDDPASQIEARGGAGGGDGGRMLIYAAPGSINSQLDVSAQAGSTAGSIYYYPRVDDLTLTAGSLAPFSGFSCILFQANNSITLAPGETLDLGAGSGQLTLEAGGDITFGNGSQITDANNWSATLEAGYNFANNTVQSGVGNIYLNGGSGQSGSGSIQLSQAAMNLTAGNSIVVGSGCQLIDDGGVIGLYAQTVDQYGLIQANSVGNQHGIIELVASDSIALGANSQITANGDASSSGSAGGQIMLQTAQTYSDDPASQIEARGGANGGDGGRVLIYAASANSQPDVSAQAGSASGQIYYYPLVNGDLTLTADSLAPFSGFSSILFQASGNINIPSYQVLSLSAGAGSRTSGQLTLEAGGDIVLKGGSQITDANYWSVTLEAGYDFVNRAVTYDNNSITLTGNSSIQTAGGNISLIAGQDITVNSGFVRTTGGGNISVWALAGSVNTGTDAKGYVFASDSSTYCQVDPNLGGISTAAGGDVAIMAGGDVTSFLPYGNAARTVGGDAGSGAFGPQPGDVTIVAGGNVTGHYVEANGTGGIYAGVEMDANGNPVKDVSGHYVLNSGSAGSAGTADNKLALSLIAGGWTVDAAQDIYLQEVRNPNGVFNTKSPASLTYHYFDYAPGAYVNLSAGNSVQLGDSSSSLPRYSDGIDVPFIYAPILNIVAGAGGVVLTGDTDPYDKLILFASPQGSLTISTGGSLVGALPSSSDGSPSIFNLIVSDSGQTQYYDNGLDIFGLTDHAATPVHINSPTPIVLDISGDMNSVLLGAPEAAQITVGGNMINSRFQGMNLSSDSSQSGQVQVRKMDGSLGLATVQPDLTSIKVTGDILNRSDFTIFTLPDGAPVPDISKLAQAIDPLAAGLAGKIFYEEVTDPVTKTVTRQLILQGALTPDIFSLLENLTYQVYANGQPQFISDGLGGLMPETVTINLLDPATPPGEAGATAQALNAAYYNPNTGPIYNPNNGPIPTTQGSGYLLGGGGQFNITARNIDLGTTLGIVSQGVSFDTTTVPDSDGNPVTIYPLAKYFTRGADINITASGNSGSGNLDMFSTSISSLNGGNISVNASGNVNVGSDVFTVNNDSVRGIFTAAQGDVTVIANGDINVNGSRIASFDGGDVTVESRAGNVNAGNGGSSTVTVSAFYVDPLTRQVYSTAPQLPFSGILALTFPQRDSRYPAPAARLGNVLVEAPRGNIIANVAGILEIPLNNESYPNATTIVLAGYELQDGAGNSVTAHDLAAGTPVLVSGNRNINASGSGVLASNAKLEASGSIDGLIFALNNIDINAQQNINVIALGQGNVNVSSSGGTVVGTIIGVGGVSVSGTSVDASLISANVSGATSGQSGLGSGTAANATAQAASSDDSTKMAAAASPADDSDDQKKKGRGAALMQKTGRVTVLLPPRQQSQAQTPEPRT